MHVTMQYDSWPVGSCVKGNCRGGAVGGCPLCRARKSADACQLGFGICWDAARYCHGITSRDAVRKADALVVEACRRDPPSSTNDADLEVCHLARHGIKRTAPT